MIDFKEKSLVITDLETTGLNFRTHEIIEIGAVAVDQQSLEVRECYSLKVTPEHIDTAEPEALAVNGYDPAQWIGAASQLQAAVDFSRFLGENVMAAWNVTFEFSFLDVFFTDRGVHNPFRTHPHAVPRFDIPSIAWFVLPGMQKWNMSRICEYFGLAVEPHPHRGLNGAMKELEILREIRKVYDAR